LGGLKLSSSTLPRQSSVVGLSNSGPLPLPILLQQQQQMRVQAAGSSGPLPVPVSLQQQQQQQQQQTPGQAAVRRRARRASACEGWLAAAAPRAPSAAINNAQVGCLKDIYASQESANKQLHVV
jgi:hypothetical protein